MGMFKDTLKSVFGKKSGPGMVKGVTAKEMESISAFKDKKSADRGQFGWLGKGSRKAKDSTTIALAEEED